MTASVLTPVVLACSDPVPDLQFTGYGFDGTDLVIGEDGLSAFEAAKGRHFGHRNPGTFWLLRRTGQGHELRTDSEGHCWLFVYRAGRRWALSNSFSALCDRVRALGWRLTPRQLELDVASVPSIGVRGPWSPRTVSREISVVPGHGHVVLRDGRIKLRPVDRSGPLPPADETIALWLGRLATVMNAPGLSHRFELTGGLDSRLVLAAALYLRDSGLLNSPEIAVMSTRRHAADFAVASHLAEAHDLVLNAPVASPTSYRSAANQYALWRAFSVGMYRTFYLPPARWPAQLVTIGGHGGERLRNCLTPVDTMAEVGADPAILGTGWTRHRARRVFAQAASQVPGLPSYHGSANWRHFRRYRNRPHAGFLTQTALRVVPLADEGLDALLNGFSGATIDSGRVLFDLMEQLTPGLAGLPYDKIGKGPGPDWAPGARRRWPVTAGQVFGSPVAVRGAAESTDSVLSWMQRDYAISRDRVRGRSDMAPWIARADAALETADRDQSRPDGDGYLAVYHVLLTGLVCR